MSIASTGQPSLASFALSCTSSGISESIALANPSSSMLNTYGHIEGHAPHPIQVSLSTFAFIVMSPLYVLY